MYQSCHRYTTKCTKWKAPISEKLLQNGKNMQKRTYYARSAYRKTCRGVANCWKLFQVGQRIPRQIIWTYLSLSASTLNMTKLTLRTIQSKFYGQFKPNRETNIDKIMLPLPTFGGNKWIDTQLILGLFSRGLKSQQFSRMWTNGLRQFSWTVWEWIKGKIEGKDRKGTTKNMQKPTALSDKK